MPLLVVGRDRRVAASLQGTELIDGEARTALTHYHVNERSGGNLTVGTSKQQVFWYPATAASTPASITWTAPAVGQFNAENCPSDTLETWDLCFGRAAYPSQTASRRRRWDGLCFSTSCRSTLRGPRRERARQSR